MVESLRRGVGIREGTKSTLKIHRMGKVNAVVVAGIGTNAIAMKNHPTNVVAGTSIADNVAETDTILAAEAIAEAVIPSEDIIDGGVVQTEVAVPRRPLNMRDEI